MEGRYRQTDIEENLKAELQSRKLYLRYAKRKRQTFCKGQRTFSAKKIDGIFLQELEKFLTNLDLSDPAFISEIR